MTTETVPIVLQSASAETCGEAHLRAVPGGAAVRNAFFAWGGCWIGAVATVPIPIVHFIAPPMLFLLGPILGIVFYKMYHGAVDIVAGGGPCPSCGVAVSLGARAERWPADVVCSGCQARLLARRVRAEA